LVYIPSDLTPLTFGMYGYLQYPIAKLGLVIAIDQSHHLWVLETSPLVISSTEKG
jgi:hypothetical protein